MSPGETIQAIRLIYDTEKASDFHQISQQIYDALRNAVWLLMAFHERNIEMSDWYELLREVEARFLSKGEEMLAAKIGALADLTLTSRRFNIAQQGISLRPHVKKILEILQAKGEGLSVEQMSTKTGMLPQFVHRISNSMAAYGLIKKNGYGHSAILSRL